MYNRLIFIFAIFLAFISCKKENDRPQWEVRVVAPLFHATLGMNNLVADSLISADSDNALHLVYEENLTDNLFNLDSLFSIPDTTILTVLTMPFVSYVLMPNTLFYSTNKNISLSISGVELRKATIKSGYLQIEARNSLETRVIYSYTMPGTTLNNVPFQFSTTMDAAPPGGIASTIELFDMSGYKVDMTGVSGNLVNTISYNVTARTDTGGGSISVFLGDTMVNIRVGFLDLVPYYAKGYLGQTEIIQDSISSLTNLVDFIRSGIIRLEEATMKITVKNNIGVDAQAFFTQIQSINTTTNSVVTMNAPSIINHATNINRASENGNTSYPVNPTTTVVQFDNGNSNLRSLIENLPDQLTYGMRLKVNPFGNISGSNDFVYSDYLVNAGINIDIPLSFAADQLALLDTTPFEIVDKEDFDPVGAGTFNLVADNGFPFDADMKLVLLNEHFQILDSIVLSVPIAAATVDANFKVTASKRTLIPILVDEALKNKILDTKNISIKASFTTPAFPQYYRIYSGYNLVVKLVADATYQIR